MDAYRTVPYGIMHDDSIQRLDIRVTGVFGEILGQLAIPFLTPKIFWRPSYALLAGLWAPYLSLLHSLAQPLPSQVVYRQLP